MIRSERQTDRHADITQERQTGNQSNSEAERQIYTHTGRNLPSESFIDTVICGW